MNKKIKLSGQDVSYQLKNNRRSKHVRLAMYCDGTLVVTKPRFVPLFYVERFLKHQSEWIIERIKGFSHNSSRSLGQVSAHDYRKYKEQALALVTARVEHFNQFYAFDVSKITVRNQRTRWGSCSRLKNLNFNYRILFLPAELVDYIIVHELCHLLEFNHSHRFWSLVQKTIPNYLQIRKKLKQGDFNSAL